MSCDWTYTGITGITEPGESGDRLMWQNWGTRKKLFGRDNERYSFYVLGVWEEGHGLFRGQQQRYFHVWSDGYRRGDGECVAGDHKEGIACDGGYVSWRDLSGAWEAGADISS